MNPNEQFHQWLSQRIGDLQTAPTLFLPEIVSAAERFFRKPYSAKIKHLSAEQFDGDTYSPKRDGKRLTTQLEAVTKVMLDGRWHTAHELVKRCGGTEASITARIRDLRKEKHGSYNVQTCAKQGTWYYRVA